MGSQGTQPSETWREDSTGALSTDSWSTRSRTSSEPGEVEEEIPWHIGEVLNRRWEIRRILGGPGRSGMGIVLVVHDRENQNIYAAKTLQGWCLARRKAVLRFENEARLWMSLGEHPNIVQAHFLEQIGDRPFIFLEYVRGSDLSRLMRSGALPVRQALRFAIQCGRAMVQARMSAPGFIHRDIKPANCLVTTRNVLKVTDFGLALTLDSGEEDDAGASTVGRHRIAGTLAYMPPEAFRRPPAIDARSDIYSFGVMLYRMLTGRYPIVGDSYSTWMMAHSTQAAHPPRTFNPRIPEALDALTMDCIQKESGKRPGGFSRILEVLEPLLEEFFGEVVPRPTTIDTESEDLRRKGLSLARLGRQEDALRSIDRAIELDPTNPASHTDRASLLVEMDRAADALESLGRALDLDPSHLEALLIESTLLEKGGRLDEALVFADRAIRTSPRDPRAWIRHASLLESRHDLVHALHDFDRVCRTSPELADGWIGKARVLVEMGAADEALKLLERALEIDRKRPELWRVRALALLSGGRRIRALRSVDRAINLEPRNSRCWRTRARILIESERHRDAIAAIERALDIEPDGASSWYLLGLVRLTTGEFEEAAADFENAIVRAPEEALYPATKARALVRLGHEAQARDTFQLAIDLDPGIHRIIDGWPEWKAVFVQR